MLVRLKAATRQPVARSTADALGRGAQVLLAANLGHDYLLASAPRSPRRRAAPRSADLPRRGGHLQGHAVRRQKALGQDLLVLDDDRTRRGPSVRAPFADQQDAPPARAPRRHAVAPPTQGHPPPHPTSKKSAGASANSRNGRARIPPARFRRARPGPRTPRWGWPPPMGRALKPLYGAGCAAGVGPRSSASLGGHHAHTQA